MILEGLRRVGVAHQELHVHQHLIQEHLNAVEPVLVDIVQAVEPVVPVPEADEQRQRDDDRHGHRQNDADEDGQLAGAVDARRLDDGLGDVRREIGAHHNDVERTHHQVREEQRRDGVFDVEGLRPHDVARHEAAVEEHGEEQEERDERPAGQIAPGERVGEQRGDGEVRDGARHGDERGQDVAAHDTRRIHEQVLVSGEIDLLGEKAVAVAHQRVFLRD